MFESLFIHSDTDMLQSKGKHGVSVEILMENMEKELSMTVQCPVLVIGTRIVVALCSIVSMLQTIA